MILSLLHQGLTNKSRRLVGSERGQFVVTKVEQLVIEHAYRTFLNMHHQIKTRREELREWLTDETVQEELAQ